MGEATAVFGRITSYGEQENSHNLDVVSKLPSQNDGFALLTKEMFNNNRLHGKMDYTIGFARSYKNIESNWHEWIVEFENFLIQCKWNNVKVILETEMLGSHQYTWVSKYYNDKKEVKIRNDYDLIEKENWYFGDGHRNFWGMRAELGWKSDFEELRTLNLLATLLSDNESTKYPTLTQIESTNYQIETDKDEYKNMLSSLLKLYLKEAQKTIPNFPTKEYNNIKLLDENSPIQINSLQLNQIKKEEKNGKDKKRWINRFVDSLITYKKKDSL